MIVLDTHVWIWWVHGDLLLPPDYHQIVQAHEATGLGISAISCWEIAKLVEYGGRGSCGDSYEQAIPSLLR